MPEEKKSRREFLKQSGGALSAALLASISLPILQSCEPTSIPVVPAGPNIEPEPDGRIPVDVSDLTTTNSGKLTNFNGPDGYKLLITRLGDEYFALSSKCTHEDGVMKPEPGELVCQKHFSRFRYDGTLIAGLAQRDLPRYDSVFDATKNVLRVKLT